MFHGRRGGGLTRMWAIIARLSAVRGPEGSWLSLHLTQYIRVTVASFLPAHSEADLSRNLPNSTNDSLAADLGLAKRW